MPLPILTLTPAGAAFIARFEGFRAVPYRCPAGKLTIGYGHVIQPDDLLPAAVAPDTALDLLMQDAAREAAPLGRALTVDLLPYQADALISLAFNLGGRRIARSTLVRLLNAGNALEATNEFGKWNKAGRRESRGLGLRRAAEQHLFETGEYGV